MNENDLQFLQENNYDLNTFNSIKKDSNKAVAATATNNNNTNNTEGHNDFYT